MVKRWRSTDWWLQSSHRHVKYNRGNAAGNVITTMYGAGWVLDILGVHIVKYLLPNHYAVKSETNKNNVKCKL